MREVYISDRDLQTNRTAEAAASNPSATDPAVQSAHLIRKNLEGKHVCPFCGAVTEEAGGPCARCTMENTPATRKATKERIGPWYVLQSRNPSAPGMRFETLLAFVRKGRVKARSVVRGPTTHQLWRFAAQVKGLSREFGVCYGCGSAVEAAADQCPQCGRSQLPPARPDLLLEPAGEQVAPDVTEYQATVDSSDTNEVEIVIPALSGLDDSLAGFRLDTPAGDTVAGMSVVSKKETASPARQAESGRPRPAGAGVGMSGRAQAATTESRRTAAPPRQAAGKPVSPNRPRQPATVRPPAPAGRPPAAPAKAGAGEAFLSPKDLAAAFKLGLDPSVNYARPDASVDADQIFGAPRKKPRRRVGRGLLLVLVLAGGGYGALMYVDPAIRTRTTTWFRGTWARVLDAMTPVDVDRNKGTLPPVRTAADEPMGRSGSGIAQSAAATQESPRTQQVFEPDAQLAASPAPARPATTQAQRPWEEVFAHPSTVPTTAEASAAATQAFAETAADQLDEMWRVRNQALDAESRGDYTSALRSYEKIKSMAPNVWPRDLDTRIDLARRKAKLAGENR